jgi:hypothetical protein
VDFIGFCKIRLENGVASSKLDERLGDYVLVEVADPEGSGLSMITLPFGSVFLSFLQRPVFSVRLARHL